MPGKRIFLISVVLVAGCGKGKSDMSSVASVPPDSLALWLDRGVPTLILDVRPDSLFETGHVPGAVRAYGKGVSDLREVFPSNPRDPIVVVGDPARAEDEARLVRDALKLGFPNVQRLEGGMAAWEAGGYAVDGSRAFDTPATED